MAPKRIFIITPSSKLGGAERNIALLADHMPRDRYLLSLATAFGTGDLLRHFRERGLDAREFPYSRTLGLFREVERARPELIHSFLLRGNWIASALKRRFPDIPWIASERGLDVTRPPWKARTNRFFLKSADLVLAVSDPVRSILITRDKLPPEKVEVLHGGIPPAEAPLPLSAEWDLPRPRLVTLALLRPEKNVELAIEAFHRLGRGSLTVIGDGPEREKLERLGPDVHFAGNLLEGRRLLSHFDLLIIPSKEEGFPNVMLEAWQAGIPVVSTDTGGARYISGPGDAALLASENDLPRKVSELVSDPAAMNEYSARGMERVKDFSIDRVINRLSEIYDRILA